MCSRWNWLAAGLLSAGAGGAVLLVETNLISGEVTTRTTWSGTNLLVGTVVIQPGVRLTIDPGTMMLMNTGAVLRVHGQLQADGTTDAPIHFTRAAVGARWSQIRFTVATNSYFRNCVFEFADSAGDHLDYYDNDCNPGTPAPARDYHEAVVVVASQVNFEGCTFRNLPDTASNAEGDALAIISDDPAQPGAASAAIRNCQFLSIGQGIHTRFSHVLVEGCYFTGKRGDNDDVDLYGESTPPPLIRGNLFLNPGHDDMINPTRCSAIIVGNVVAGGDDHGIVLRDHGAPVVMNNLIDQCANGGIAVQNQCDALLVNNTIVGCGRGIRLFDHTTRWGPPYCLAPGSGRTTVINCLVWDCPVSFELQDSPSTQDPGSHVTVLHCDIEGGLATASVSANSTLTWGSGNLDANPQFAAEYRLTAGSPCLDAGTNVLLLRPDLAQFLAYDRDGVPRPLDSDGDRTSAFDMGASEFLLASADSNADGIPDGWCQGYGLSPVDPAVAGGNPDEDAQTTWEEWVADTDPTQAQSFFALTAISNGPPWSVHFLGSTNGLYTLLGAADLAETNGWHPVPGQVDVPGAGGPQSLADGAAVRHRFYRLGVRLR